MRGLSTRPSERWPQGVASPRSRRGGAGAAAAAARAGGARAGRGRRRARRRSLLPELQQRLALSAPTFELRVSVLEPALEERCVPSRASLAVSSAASLKRQAAGPAAVGACFLGKGRSDGAARASAHARRTASEAPASTRRCAARWRASACWPALPHPWLWWAGSRAPDSWVVRSNERAARPSSPQRRARAGAAWRQPRRRRTHARR